MRHYYPLNVHFGKHKTSHNSTICKRSDKKYYIPSKGVEHFSSHPSPNSLMVDVQLCTKYNFATYSKFTPFIEHLPQDQFQSIIVEGQLVTKTSIQAALDATNTTSISVGHSDGHEKSILVPFLGSSERSTVHSRGSPL